MRKGGWVGTMILILACIMMAVMAVTRTVAPDMVETGRTIQVSTEDRIRGAVFGALVADAMTLGSHFEYDASRIRRAYNDHLIPHYMAPGDRLDMQRDDGEWAARRYHPGTVAGDQTDNGQYNLLVLEYLAEINDSDTTFQDNAKFLMHWEDRVFRDDWKQWRCAMTNMTRRFIHMGRSKKQLGGHADVLVIRSTPFLGFSDDEDTVVEYAQKAIFTHRGRLTRLGNAFFTRVSFRLIHDDATPRAVIEQVADDMEDHWISQRVKEALTTRQEFADDAALTQKGSSTQEVLQGAIYFIVKYADDMEMAFQANTMVGGDSASRAIAIGMVLGAYHGVDAISSPWREDLNSWYQTEEWLANMPLLRGTHARIATEL